jgi:hypothetical protein
MQVSSNRHAHTFWHGHVRPIFTTETVTDLGFRRNYWQGRSIIMITSDTRMRIMETSTYLIRLAMYAYPSCHSVKAYTFFSPGGV